MERKPGQSGQSRVLWLRCWELHWAEDCRLDVLLAVKQEADIGLGRGLSLYSTGLRLR